MLFIFFCAVISIEVAAFFFYHGREEAFNEPEAKYMDEAVTFETMPKAMMYLIGKVEALEKALTTKSEVPATPTDRWLNIDELIEHHPDHPAKATVYGWVSNHEIPYHKGGKKLRFLKSEIDNWLSSEKRKSKGELKTEAENYCSTKKIHQ